MAYAKSSLIQDIRHLLNDEPWETTSTTTLASGTVAVPDGTKWGVGDIGEWQTGTVGGEQFLVQSISSNTLTVSRGYNGTTAETHTSGDRVVKNPRYSYIQITDSIDRVIETLYPNLWKQVTSTVTPDSTTFWFDSGLSTTEFIDLIRGEQRYGTSDTRVGTYGTVSPRISSLPVFYERNMPTALVSSGTGVRFPGGFHHSSNTITMRWRAKLTSTVSGSNYSDIDEGVLSEIVALGVCSRLVSAKEIPNVSEDARVGSQNAGTFVGTASYFTIDQREKIQSYRAEIMEKIPPLKDQDYVPGYW
jgi:hypothetical protein